MIAHGVSRGFHVRKGHQPQRGDRRGRLQCTETSREAAKPRRRRGVMARRVVGIAQGESWFALCPANATTEPNPWSRNLALRR